MVSFVKYWYNKKQMLGELFFVVACFKKALRDFRDHPEHPGPIQWYAPIKITGKKPIILS